jgi:tRNA threonylcarbamoyladenosine modification (KEOPS) complex Cgi121 subunit
MSGESAEASVTAWRTRVRPGTAEDVRDSLLKSVEGSGKDLLVVDGETVFGTDHLSSAYHHASKAIREGRNTSESVIMETLLYASGERQLSGAIRRMGVSKDSEEVVVALLGGGEIDIGPGWEPLPATPQETQMEKYLAFGCTPEELGTVVPGRWPDLVLERVAAVDVLKR